jgi:hypothetical protein
MPAWTQLAHRSASALRTLLLTLSVSFLCAAPALAADTSPAASKSAAKGTGTEKDAASAALDEVVLKSGRVVQGKILEENDREIKIRISVSGIEAVTTYPKSDVLEIKRAALKEAVASNAPAKDSPLKAGNESKDEKKTDAPSADAPAADDQAVLFVVELEGRFGLDISETPMKAIFEEADKAFNDLVPGTGLNEGKKVVDPSKRDRHVIVIKLNTFSQPGFGSVFRSEELAPIAEEQIIDRGRRVVFWVELAGGGAAFLPWVSPEIYFTSDGKLGGITDLDEFSSGDHMVDEKLISAFLGHAEGFAIKGGYGDHIPALRAMLRTQVWLAVRMEGGKPNYLMRQPTKEDGEGWTILSDDGKDKNKDTSALKGNDLLILEADWASKLGISDGVADSVDDIAFRLGFGKNYKAIEKKENRAQRAVDDWKKSVSDALRQIVPPGNPSLPPGKLWVEFSEIPQGSDADEVKRNRGRKVSILKQIRALASRFAESIGPGAANGMISQIDTMLAQLQLEAEQQNNRR